MERARNSSRATNTSSECSRSLGRARKSWMESSAGFPTHLIKNRLIAVGMSRWNHVSENSMSHRAPGEAVIVDCRLENGVHNAPRSCEVTLCGLRMLHRVCRKQLPSCRPYFSYPPILFVLRYRLFKRSTKDRTDQAHEDPEGKISFLPLDGNRKEAVSVRNR